MKSTIKADLEMFNQLVEVLLEEEAQKPVAERIEAEELYNTIDLSLNKEPILDEDFKKTLQDVLIATPKTATNLFFNQRI